MALPDHLQGLLDPGSYPHSCSHIELIETHISWVLLTGDYAYKLKKPVRFNFVDFSTLERRSHFCREEVRLNRRPGPVRRSPMTGRSMSSAVIRDPATRQ